MHIALQIPALGLRQALFSLGVGSYSNNQPAADKEPWKSSAEQIGLSGYVAKEDYVAFYSTAETALVLAGAQPSSKSGPADEPQALDRHHQDQKKCTARMCVWN